MTLEPVVCPHCGGSMEAPQAGGLTHCAHCGQSLLVRRDPGPAPSTGTGGAPSRCTTCSRSRRASSS